MATTTDEPPRLYRSVDNRLVAGVCAGLARHLGLETRLVRLAMVVLSLAGVGLAIYPALVFFVAPESSAGIPRTQRARRRGIPLAGYVGLIAVFWLLFRIFGGAVDPLLWFIVFGVLGGALLWHQANPAQRDTWIRSSGLLGARNLVRVVTGVVLIVVGVGGFIVFRSELQEAQQGLSATLAVLIGSGLVAAPWIIGLMRERDQERRERIRSQERAELAAHIHDSVLQTLTLIQRRSEDPREVQRLARVQERALRNWLYQRPKDAETTLTPALERVAAEVEQLHGVAIEVVCVGDCPLDDAIRAALQAAREAMVNASKYADVDSVSVYAESEPEQILVFVRDRGAGFDPEAVPADRMGIRGSIIDRMERHGGSARIRSAPGEGTEVQLTMPRSVGSQ